MNVSLDLEAGFVALTGVVDKSSVFGGLGGSVILKGDRRPIGQAIPFNEYKQLEKTTSITA